METKRENNKPSVLLSTCSYSYKPTS